MTETKNEMQDEGVLFFIFFCDKQDQAFILYLEKNMGRA
jgi:hypothetical protein